MVAVRGPRSFLEREIRAVAGGEAAREEVRPAGAGEGHLGGNSLPREPRAQDLLERTAMTLVAEMVVAVGMVSLLIPCRTAILDAQSKTGVRPWVASYLGVTEHSDDWLAILVKLLLEIHGSSWQLHDHTGKSFSPDGKSAKVGVASFSQDVGFVRALLLDALERGLRQSASLKPEVARVKGYVDVFHDALQGVAESGEVCRELEGPA